MGKAKAFKGNALNGDGQAWGVKQDGAVVYETMFVEPTAKELALLCNSMPNASWERHEQFLKRQGCDMSDPARPITLVRGKK